MELDDVPSDDDDELAAEVAPGVARDEKQDSDVEQELVTRFGRGESQVVLRRPPPPPSVSPSPQPSLADLI